MAVALSVLLFAALARPRDPAACVDAVAVDDAVAAAVASASPPRALPPTLVRTRVRPASDGVFIDIVVAVDDSRQERTLHLAAADCPAAAAAVAAVVGVMLAPVLSARGSDASEDGATPPTTPPFEEGIEPTLEATPTTTTELTNTTLTTATTATTASAASVRWSPRLLLGVGGGAFNGHVDGRLRADVALLPPSWPALVGGLGLSVWWPVSVGNRPVLVRVVDAGLGVEPRVRLGDVEVAPSLAVRGGVAIGARLDAQGQTRWTPSALVEGGVRVGTCEPYRARVQALRTQAQVSR